MERCGSSEGKNQADRQQVGEWHRTGALAPNTPETGQGLTLVAGRPPLRGGKRIHAGALRRGSGKALPAAQQTDAAPVSQGRSESLRLPCPSPQDRGHNSRRRAGRSPDSHGP